MAAKKHLGRGLDLLLSSASQGVRGGTTGILDLELAGAIFTQALNADEIGDYFEAYYLYRKLIDALKEQLAAAKPAVSHLVSQAMNNAAIILYENGQAVAAQAFLQQAAELCPDNQVVRENLQLMGQ